MRVRLLALAFGAVTLGALAWSDTEPPSARPVPIPSFAATAGISDPAAPPGPRPTLLPADCTEIVAGPVSVEALLGRPSGSIAVQTIVGVPAPAVGMVERTTCNYQPTGANSATVLQIALAAFTDPTAAGAQRQRNIDAEHDDTRSVSPVALGTARATVLTEPTHTLLMLDYDRYTLTASLAHGLFPAAEEPAVLTDLARRVLPTLTPPPAPRPLPSPPPTHPTP